MNKDRAAAGGASASEAGTTASSASPVGNASAERTAETEGTTEPSPLQVLLGAEPRRPVFPPDPTFVATCIDPRHPTLIGRVKIAWGEPGAATSDDGWWVPTLHGLTIRDGDRLLLARAAGSVEPIVVGVIDGFLPRPETVRQVAAQIQLERDETLRVCADDGQPLVEIVRDEAGPVVRLLQADTRLDLRGKLQITATELELKASQGAVRIEASGEVSLVGEIVHLN
jgi:hypothetical protein